MAEGWARHLKGDVIQAYSAGLEVHGLNPNAVKVMAEAGVDISQHRSKQVPSLANVGFDYVVTVCDNAHETCPLFPGTTKVFHMGFDDPPRLAKTAKTEEEALAHYRRVRDEIRALVEKMPDILLTSNASVGNHHEHQRERPIMMESQQDKVREQVRQRYAGIAKAGGSCCGGGGCCTPAPSTDPGASAKIGYDPADMAAAPEGANMGLGCGNPQAIASLKPGETVVDLGSGGGFDCFLAANKVGPAGRVIGIDMTPEMVSKARANALKGGYRNVEFRLGEIEHLPMADGTADVLISNCVINLSPDKAQTYADAYRVLRAGGRLAISDVVAIRDIPADIKSNLDSFSGCVAGAAQVAEIEKMLHAVGFVDVHVSVQEDSRHFIKDWFPGSGAEKYVRSASITARK